MRDPIEIIFEIDNVSELNITKQNNKIKCISKDELNLFNKHLKLCKPWYQRIFFKGMSETDWENLSEEGIEYYLLFTDDKPVARCAIEKYSDTAWEAADVKTVTKYRNRGLSKELVSFVTRKILEENKVATCSTMPNNSPMLNVIRSLGFQKADIKKFFDVTIEPLLFEDYHKCSNIWNMKAQPLSEKWRDEISSGNRMVFIYKINGEFIGEGALVFDTGDPDYTIPHKRVYVSRMIVKKEYRGRGIGSDILDFLIAKAKEMGFSEMAIGVDKDNIAALNLYKKFGFTNVLFDGADEDGEYFKLMKTL